MRAVLLFSLPFLPLAAAADDAIARVEVGAPAPLQLRRGDNAGRIVVTRDELLRHGDATVADTLRRQPGVAVNGGQVQLRGMGGGRTQFLIDGDPAPPGFSPDNLAPELIERVEILRGASADSAGQGIAGSINIVLRKTATRLRTAATLAGERSAAGWSPGATVDLARPGESWSGTLAGQWNRTRRTAGATIAEQATAAERRTSERDDSVVERFGLVPRLNWKSGGATLAWNGLLDASRGDNEGSAHETTLRGSASAYPRNGYTLHARAVVARSDISGTSSVGDSARVEWKAGLAHNRRTGDYLFTGSDQAGHPLWRRAVLSTAQDDSAGSSGKVRFGGTGRHALTAGWDGAVTRRSETRRQQDSDVAGTPLGGLDQRYTARVRRLALYAQDEWSPAATVDISAGLRWEGLRTVTAARGMDDAASSSGVFSPVANLLWRVPGGRDQVRLALARTYKAPETRDLVPRRFTVNNGNGPANPHVQGNPALRPELAWGIDAAYEKYLGGADMVSVSAYGRRIDDVILPRLFQDGAEWVSSPHNGGKAITYGIEADGRLNVGPGTVARLTLARNRSRVDAVPGPDNRLGEQTPFTANMGIDYRFGPGATAGFNWHVQGGGTSRTSATQWRERGTLRRLDLYGSWQPRAGVTLRATAADLLDAAPVNVLRFVDGASDVRRAATGSGSRTVRLAAEFAL